MPSYDEVWRIERYPVYDDAGELESVSYGCPSANIMGYSSIHELIKDLRPLIIAKELVDFQKNEDANCVIPAPKEEGQ